MRPYTVSRRAGPEAFYDVAYSITHVVYTLNDYGQFLLDPSWLPEEYEFLRARLADAVAIADPDLTGEFLDALRAFGVPSDDPVVEAGFDYLLATQNADGSWGEWDASTLRRIG